MVEAGGGLSRMPRGTAFAAFIAITFALLLSIWGCVGREDPKTTEPARDSDDAAVPAEPSGNEGREPEATKDDIALFDGNTPVSEVASDPAFGSWGRLLFPVDEGYMRGSALGYLSFTWYSHVDPE